MQIKSALLYTVTLFCLGALADNKTFDYYTEKKAYDQRWTGLKYISLPSKKPLPLWDTVKLSQTAQNTWAMYEKLYDRFYRSAKIFEQAYEKSNKAELYAEYLKQMNTLAKNPGWKFITTTQPFQVQHGKKQITDPLNRLFTAASYIEDELKPSKPAIVLNNQNDDLNRELVLQNLNPRTDIPTVNKHGQPFSTQNERSYYELKADAQNMISYWAREQYNNSTRSGNYDPAKFSQAKQLKRMGMRTMEYVSKIREDAKRNGEEWAQEDDW